MYHKAQDMDDRNGVAIDGRRFGFTLKQAR